MDYSQTLEYLYSKLPMFTRIGAAAIKNDLDNTIAFCEALGNPQHKFKSIHIAGTNGKGSVSHCLASILQTAGFKVGLYTSPHLLDFRERIRINGNMIPQENVVSFVSKYKELMENIEPSFFEMTVAMAFDHFRNEEIDYAIIETGLGGRLDSTNIITPVLSVITNISYDHQYLLGNTLPEIAAEKAGIIKPGIPVVIGKTSAETEHVFLNKAIQCQSDIYFSEKYFKLINHSYKHGMLEIGYLNNNDGKEIFIASPLAGNYQLENLATVLTSISVLNKNGFSISEQAITNGIRDVKKQTGLLGRWEIISESPLVICDVAHNEAGLKAVFEQVHSIPHKKLRIVYGMVKDKDIEKALALLPKEAEYYFTQPQLPRALDYQSLFDLSIERDLKGQAFPDIAMACKQALAGTSEDDIVLVAGSIFVVAEALEYFGK